MNIIHPNNSFDFTKLTLAQPSGLHGGAYFTKLNYNQSPLYIQTPKSLTKQSIITSGKKLYCDLMFENQLNDLIEWFEKLETTCQQLILEKSEEWFQDPLQLNDIENIFNSILKIYKSGKYYLARVNVKNTINVYDETRQILSIEDIKIDTHIISILEIQGIKFTTRNFQLEIELKQAMIIDNSPVFNNCLISPISGSDVLDKFVADAVPDAAYDAVPDAVSNATSSLIDKVTISDDESSSTDSEDEKPNDSINTVDLEFEDLSDGDKKEDLIEITEMTESSSEPLVLKKPTDVYYKIYREARAKAKYAKKQAILALLEAKNIKKTYMLNEIDGSDKEFDDEIDNISESELLI